MAVRKKKANLKLLKSDRAKTGTKNPLAELTFTAESKEALKSSDKMHAMAVRLHEMTEEYREKVRELGLSFKVHLGVRTIFQARTPEN